MRIEDSRCRGGGSVAQASTGLCPRRKPQTLLSTSDSVFSMESIAPTSTAVIAARSSTITQRRDFVVILNMESLLTLTRQQCNK
ncbi:MAG: hypothetical protein MN733_28490, partial [Nitrososphaera sp.]|nr:hypothetical protein [Nitrososphaera sp.]